MKGNKQKGGWRGCVNSAYPLLSGLALSVLLGVSGMVQAQPANSDTSNYIAQTMLADQPAVSAGQAVTRLADGRWLFSGGRQNPSQLRLVDLRSGQNQVLAPSLGQPRSGHTATLLPDGSVLIYGGTNASGAVLDTAEQFDPFTSTLSMLGSIGLLPRTAHTANVLTDGRVLIVGGTGSDGQPVLDADLYNPRTRQAERFNARLDTARARQISALLPDRSVLLWGGVDGNGKARGDGDRYDPSAQQISAVGPDAAKKLAQTLSNGDNPAVLGSIPTAHAVDVPVGQALQVRFSKRLDVSTLNAGAVTLIGPTGNTALRPVSVENGVVLFVTPAEDLQPGANYTLFISGAADEDGRPLPFTAIGFTTATLGSSSSGSSGGGGVASSSGTGGSGATAGSSGTVIGLGPVISAGGSVANPIASIAGILSPYLSPQDQSPASPLDNSELWLPGEPNYHGNWNSGRKHWAEQFKPSQELVRRAIYGNPEIAQLKITPATVASGILNKYNANIRKLYAGSGVTAVAGQVLKLNGRPLADVSLTIGSRTARTNGNGEFMLSGVPAGHQVLVIEGATAGSEGRRYGRYEYGMDVVAGKLNALPFVIWMTRLDDQGNASIPSPTTAPIVLTNPKIPGLELHIPAGTVIRDASGKIVTQLNMTAIPTDQPPFPIPSVPVPTYFTIQPGGAHLESANGQPFAGAQLIYPNFTQSPPGARISFWNYDPTAKGWYIYGMGTVTNDGTQVVPDPGVVIYEFSGAMVSQQKNAAGEGPTPCPKNCTGDPVDVSTGLFTNLETDLIVPDVIPITISRSYRQLDPASRGFGIGTNLNYDFFTVGDIDPYTYQELILPDGTAIYYPRVSLGTSWTDAVYASTSAPGQFYGSIIKYTGDVVCFWTLTLKDGTSYCFAEEAGSPSARAAAVRKIIDARGNVLTLTRDYNYNLTGITSPNGRHVSLAYDSSNRVYQAQDDSGRTVTYGYNAPSCTGCLYSVTDPAGNAEFYNYDGAGDMTSVVDRRGTVKVVNVYDSNSRVIQQTYAPNTSDQTVASWSYTLDANGNVTNTLFTDQRNVGHQYAFNANGYPTSIVDGVGTPAQQSTTYDVSPDTNLVNSITDALGRTTSYAYDALGNVTQVTRLAGTGGAVTTSIQYNQAYSEPTLLTDALGDQYQFSYDSSGNLVQSVDPLNHVIAFGHDTEGRLTSITDANNNTTTVTWYGADEAAMTDALGRTTLFNHDALGRLTGVTNAAGARATIAYDVLNRVTNLIDPNGAQLQFGFDSNSNLVSHTDANSNKTTFTYDAMNRIIGKADALKQSESFGYEAGGLLNQHVDRKGQQTGATVDSLGRPSTMTMADGSTIAYTFDAGDRVTQLVDSVNGTITRTYDGMDNLLTETTPQGTVTYTYDALNRRQTMTVQGQPTLTYAWDNASRLTGIFQGSTELVGFSYDPGNRRTQVVLPNGNQAQYSYDSANELTQIAYANPSGAPIGAITYSYDAAGRRVATGGSLADATVPASAASGIYDANNRLTSWNGGTLTYDADGNLLSDSSNSYTWNARNQLAQVNGTSYAYDAFGRRTGVSTSGNSTSYVFDGLNFVQEQAGGQVAANEVTGGVDQIFSRSTGAGAASMLTDGLGSVVAETDAGGNSTASYSYDPYGNTTLAGTGTSLQQYTGRQNDGGGLYYYRARYYSTATGRFLSEDPIDWASGQPNDYAYVRGNPISYTDPSGRDPILFVVGGIIGGGLGYVNGLIAGDSGQELANDALTGALTGSLAGLTDGLSLLPGIALRAGLSSAIEAGRQAANSYEKTGCVKLNPLDIAMAAGGSIFGDALGAGPGAELEDELGYGGMDESLAHQLVFAGTALLGGIPGLMLTATEGSE